MADPTTEPPDKTAKPGDPATRTAKQWLDEITQAEKDLAAWTKRAKKVERIWLEQREEADNLKRQYALLWANISVLQPAVYAKSPQPVVTRRFSDRDPVARNVSEVLERSLVTLFDHADIDTCMKAVRDNFLVVGQGTAWVRYIPSFETKQFEIEGAQQDVETLSDETLGFDFVHWSDFIRPKARRWEDLPWVGRRVYPDEATGIRRFGKEKWDKVKAATAEKSTERSKGAKDQPCVYEIWSKRDKKVFWVAKGFEDEFLDEKAPLYALRGFFPCPRPAFATVPTDSLEPVPDYIYYQDQAEEVNKLTARIGALEDSLKLVGFYPAGAEGGISTAIETALSGDTQNKMIPVPSWAAFVQSGGSKAMIEWLPVEQVLIVLKGCVELRKQLIDDVFQITGISDIIRGASDPRETKGAQTIKAQWGGIRIRDRQAELARFARDMTRIAAEILAEKFQPETLWRLSGLKFPSAQEKQMLQMQIQQQQQQMAAMQAQQAPQQPGQPSQAPMPPKPPELPPKVKEILESPTQEDLIALMKDDKLRGYRIDIETDSTIAADEEAEKSSRQEFVTVLGTMLGQALPVAQQVPELVPVIGESLLFLTRAYRTGRQLEDTIETAVAAITAKAGQSQNQPPPPDPAMLKAQADQEASKAKLALQAEETKAKLQLSGQESAARLQMDKQAQDASIENDRTKIMADHQTKQAQIAMNAAPQQDDVSAKLDALVQGMQQLQMIVQALLPPSMPQTGLAQ